MATTNTISPVTKTVSGHCYCKSINYTVTLPVAVLPISTHLCHCSVCRYTHGTMCIFHASLPKGYRPQFTAPSSLEESTTTYHPPGAFTYRYFCRTCGCHMGDFAPAIDQWFLATALIPKDESVFIIDEHIYVKSAPEGLQDWLPAIGDRQLRFLNAEAGAPEDAQNAEPLIPKAEKGADGEDRLRAQCHCGGVSFTIRRPSEQVLSDDYKKQFVSSADKRKWKAIIDCCNDCRLNSGVHINAWTFIPLESIEPSIDTSFQHGTMKTYVSSPGVIRTFCGVCGATVFFWCEHKKSVVDVAVGILRAPEGVRAESWLTWRTGRLGWLDAGKEYDEQFYESLSEGMSDWGKMKYGEAIDFEVPD